MEAKQVKRPPLGKKQVNKESVMGKANELLNEQIDEVKKMNQVMMQARCNNIRKGQIEQKKIIQNFMVEREKKMDEMFEVKRL